MRPMQEMASAPAAITTAEAFNRHRQMRKVSNQITFICPWESPGSEDRAGHRKHIDVPVERFAAAHMTRNAASQPTRALGRAAVQISTGSERRARVPNPRHHRLTQIDQQDVSAARCGDVLSARPEFCCSAGSHAVMRTGVAAAALKIGVSARRPRGCRHARACRDPGCRD